MATSTLTKSLCLSLVAIIGVAIVAVFAANVPKQDNTLEALKAQYKRPADIPFPKDNLYSKEKATLGKTLFFETRISRSGVMNCASCHNPGFNWTDGNAKGIGDHHQILGRKDPALLNLAWDELFFWDGRADSLEHQVVGPIEAAGEMNMKLPEAVARIKTIKEYHALFAHAFPGEQDAITKDNIAKALATYVRTIVSEKAPFDHWVNGDDQAISENAKRGFMIFNTKGNCASCHSGWRQSDGSFHDIGIKDDDIGRGKFLPMTQMQHAFKTVGLRNIDRRAPYMHNGSMNTLEEVIDHYDHGFVQRKSLSDQIKPLNLTPQEKKDLVAYLKTLTSEDKPVTIPDMPK